MDQALLKRNTDCVYFLASPFTCKKGSECEYRHSEMARLNPSDCWFWLSGSCLNTTCAFRHPPMEVHTEASAQPEVLPNNSSFPPSKNNVPCYFYFNGYCNKGDKCPFLHGYEDKPAGKPKVYAASNDAPSLDTKVASEASVPKKPAESSDAKAPARVSNTKVPSRMLDRQAHPSPLEKKAWLKAGPTLDQPEKCPRMPEVTRSTLDKAALQQNLQIQSSDAYHMSDRKIIHECFASEYEEAVVSGSGSLNGPESVVKSDPGMYSDQSLGEQVDEDVVRDEWWESSPGLDVLVEGQSEGMAYGDEQEDVHGYGRNDEDHENNLIDEGYCNQRDFSDRFMHDDKFHEPSYYSDDDERYDFIGHSHGGRERTHLMQHKSKFLRVRLPVGSHYGVDLREHLIKRRSSWDYLERRAERRAFRCHDFSLRAEEEMREPQLSGSTQRIRGRLASKLERDGISLPKVESMDVPDQRDSVRHYHERKRPRISSRVQGKPFKRRKRDNEESISFAGTKTGDENRVSRQNSSVDFEGPKPLSEILKGKRAST